MKVFLERGKHAFDGCPACGERVIDFDPGDIEEGPLWTFDCGCELSWTQDEGIEIEDACPDATRSAVNQLTVIPLAMIEKNEGTN